VVVRRSVYVRRLGTIRPWEEKLGGFTEGVFGLSWQLTAERSGYLPQRLDKLRERAMMLVSVTRGALEDDWWWAL
jgi:hypothetical protein